MKKVCERHLENMKMLRYIYNFMKFGINIRFLQTFTMFTNFSIFLDFFEFLRIFSNFYELI